MPFRKTIAKAGAIALVIAGTLAINTAGMAASPSSIKVVLDDNYPPLVFRDDNGKVVGQLVDTWALWTQKTGIAVDLRAMDWAQARATMAAGNADVIDTIFKTPDRERTLDFSDPYATVDVVIFYLNTLSGITGPSTLHGFTVGVKDGDACADWLTQRGISRLERYSSYEATIAAAARHEILTFCMDLPPAEYLLTKRNLQSDFRHTAPLFSGQFRWAVAKGKTDLRDAVTAGFAQITPDERASIAKRWHGYDIEAPNWLELAADYAWIVGLAAAIGLGVILWAWMLRRQVARKTASLTQAMAALSASEDRFRTIFDNINDAILIYNPATQRIVGANLRVSEMFRLDDRDPLSMTIEAFSFGASPLDQTSAMPWMNQALSGAPQVFEWLGRRGDDDLFWIEVGVRLARIDGTEHLLILIHDITDRKAAENRLQHASFHDPLTQLPNQALIADGVGRGLDAAMLDNQQAALLLCDLDQFKTINDSLGHLIGDRYLCEVARRFSDTVRHRGAVGRQGGDEFIVFLRNTSRDKIEKLVQTLHASIAEPIELDGHVLQGTLSTGIALFPDDGKDFETLLKLADMAMYQAKTAGRNAYRFVTAEMNTRIVEHIAVLNGLRKAIERKEFVLFYQPQVRLADGVTTGAEALIRWQHPEQGLIPPGRFISIAEDGGLIVPIGTWVLREACRQAALWERAGHRLRIAVNLSALQFRDHNLEATVEDALIQSGLSPDLLELELTETVLLDINDTVLSTFARLRAKGVQLSIDDFGTGYSSLAYIKRLAVNRLKIDRAFIGDLHENPDSAAIAAAIIQLAHSLGIEVLAEGVEAPETLSVLRDWHCEAAQGFFFGRPVPASAFFIRGSGGL